MRSVLLSALLLAAPQAASAQAAFDQGIDVSKILEQVKQAPVPRVRAPSENNPPKSRLRRSEKALWEITLPAQRMHRLTKTKYEALVASGGRLTFSTANDWLPQTLKDNLVASIEHAFRTSMTDELSWRDFNHGHLEAPIGPAGDPTGDAVRKALHYTEACGPFAMNLPYIGRNERPADFSRKIYAPNGRCPEVEVREAFKAALTLLAADPRHLVLYHTRETTYETLDPQETNRTIVTHAGGVPQTVNRISANESAVRASIQLVFYATDDGILTVHPEDRAYWMSRPWHTEFGLKPPR